MPTWLPSQLTGGPQPPDGLWELPLGTGTGATTTNSRQGGTPLLCSANTGPRTVALLVLPGPPLQLLCHRGACQEKLHSTFLLSH